MDRRTLKSPMDWEWQDQAPSDSSSPFSFRTRPDPFSSTGPKSAFSSQSSNVARPSFTNPLFTTPRAKVASDDEGPGLTEGGRHGKPTRHVRNPASTKRGRRVLKSSTEFSDADQMSDFPDSSSESTDVSDFQWTDNGAAREATPIVSRKNRHSSNRESERDQFTPSALAILAAFYIGGSFYYKVVSVSILAVWIYSTLMFPTTDVPSSGKRQSHRLGRRFYIWVRNFAKLVGLLLLIAWCVVLSPIHIFIPTPMDAWTRYSDHPTFRSFEVLHDPGDSSIVEVFAVHGLGSNPSSAWRYGGNGTQVHWLRDLLPKQKGLDNIKITILNHQTRWDSHSPEVDFDVFAKMMLDDIEHLHQQNRPIIFIAHSFGGLLLKRSLVLATTRSKHIPQMTRGILFLGVPHHGTKAAFVASLLASTAYWRGSSTTMLEYMSESNPAVATLDKEFYEAYARPSQTREYSAPYLCNFLELRPERFGKLSLRPTVNINSGTLRYAEDVFLDTDHRGLNKFQSSSDPNFEKFLRHFHHAVYRDDS